MIEQSQISKQTKYQYQICGFRLQSNIPFLFPQAPAQERQTAEISFTLKSPGIPTKEIFSRRLPLGHIKNGAGQTTINVYKIHQGFLLDCNNGYKEIGFVIAPDGSWIDCFPQAGVSSEDIELWLFGLVLAFLLQGRGIYSLHAAAVVCHEQVIAFLGNNRFGKSTMAFFFLQHGHSLITDDVLPIMQKEGLFFTLPVCPSINLWSNTLAQFRKTNEHLSEEKTNLSKRRYSLEALNLPFCKSEAPLGGIYFLNPQHQEKLDKVQITALPQASALLNLLSFTRANSMIALPDQKNLLKTYTNLVSQVPVRLLSYPIGFEFLPEVRDAVLQASLAN